MIILKCWLHYNCAAARLVCSAQKYEQITPLRRDLHWLRVPEQIEFKLSVLIFQCLHNMAEPYYADICPASYVVWLT